MSASTNDQVTWGGRFAASPSSLMLLLGESVSFDARLAPYDIQGSKAHAAMLCQVGLLTADERDAIHAGLEQILRDIQEGTFQWKTELEDVHMNIEQALTAITPAGAKLHTARSRNDQVATDMRLFFKDSAQRLIDQVEQLMGVLLDLAEAHPEVVIPGYTHLQRAQPVLLAHHLLAYVTMLGRDRERLSTFHQQANWCPLGSGAIAGSTLPIDRAWAARELGFVDQEGQVRLTANSMDAVADRDLYVEFACICALIGTHLSRMAEDGILWASSEFGLIRLPDAFTTGSSLMPQKKNPDSLELIRGKAARLQGNLQTLLTLTKGLPLTYNRDLQEDKPPVFDSLDQTLLCLAAMAGTFAGITINTSACAKAVADPMLLATDLADFLVEQGLPFRQAHHAVGRLVRLAETTETPIHQLPQEDALREVPELGSEWRAVFQVERALSRREKPGMPGPQQVASELAAWRQRLRPSGGDAIST